MNSEPGGESTLTYTNRPSASPRVYTYELDASGISSRADSGASRRIDYADIVEVNMSVVGGRISCRIRSPREKLTIDSHRFVSLGEFQFQGAEFLTFVWALHEMLAPHADSIRFKRGSGFMFYLCIGLIVICVLVIAAVPIAIVTAGKRIDAQAIVIMLSAGGLGVGALLPLALMSKPRRYECESPPFVARPP